MKSSNQPVVDLDKFGSGLTTTGMLLEGEDRIGKILTGGGGGGDETGGSSLGSSSFEHASKASLNKESKVEPGNL